MKPFYDMKIDAIAGEMVGDIVKATLTDRAEADRVQAIHDKCLHDNINANKYYKFLHWVEFADCKLKPDGRTLECRAPGWVVEICRVMDDNDIDLAESPDSLLHDTDFANRLFHAVNRNVLDSDLVNYAERKQP